MKVGEMFSGIGGFRFGLEKASNLSNSNSHTKRETDTEDEYSIGERHNSLERNETSREERTTNSRTIDRCAERQSYRCVWANDIDKYACQIYRKHYGTKELLEADIKTINPDSIPDFELLTAGFPCQSFSLAGKRRGFEDTRGTLFYEVARIAEAKRPKRLLLENVKGLLSNDEGRTFAKILQTLDELGYDVEWQVLNSKHFGVPQNRERVFIVGHSRAEPTRQIFPIRETGELSCSENRSEQKAEKRIRSRHIPLASTLEASYGKTKSLTNTVSNTLSNRYGKDGSENLILSHSPRTNNPKLGGSEPLLSKEHCFTVDSTPHKLISKGRIRRLTPTECERLQGFPDGWTEDVSDTQRYKLLGNAVTTNVIEFLGQRLSEVEVRG
jgi:DNA (cytosine-5)-methyltransferase 1